MVSTLGHTIVNTKYEDVVEQVKAVKEALSKGAVDIYNSLTSYFQKS
jgi:hypothetical protein